MIAESSPFPWFSTARQRTRRVVVVAYWIFALSLFGLFEWAQLFRHHEPGVGLLLPLQIVIFLPAILGGVRAGGMVKPFDRVRWAPINESDGTQTLFGPARPLVGSMTAADLTLDEREQSQRDHVHYFAYTAARWVALALLAAQFGVSLVSQRWMLDFGAAAFFLLALTLWSLPQTLILWTEPDVEEPQ